MYTATGETVTNSIRPIVLVLALLLATSLSFAEAKSYTVQQQEGARFALIVEKTGFLSGKKHLFVFEEYSGELAYDAEAPGNSEIKLIIQAASIDCRDDWVSEKDLVKIQREAEEKLLQVEKFAEIVFVSQTIVPIDGDSYNVQGLLTIRDKTQPVLVRVELTESESGLRFKGASVVNMKEFGLKPPSAAFGTVGTKKEMQVEFDLAAVPAP
jgi:polyisoprenoid-binding protein YceI